MNNIINYIIGFFTPATSVESILGAFLKVQADLEAHAVRSAAKAEALQDQMDELRAVQYAFDAEAGLASLHADRLHAFLTV